MLATDPRVVQPAPRESRPLGALEPTAIPPLSPPLLRCVWHRSSQQDVTIDSDYLGLSLLLANAYGRLTHEGEGFLFSKCSFPGSSFCTAVDRECCFSRKAAVGESFLVLFYDGGKKRSFSCMRYDGKARIPPTPGLAGWGSSVSQPERGEPGLGHFHAARAGGALDPLLTADLHSSIPCVTSLFHISPFS